VSKKEKFLHFYIHRVEGKIHKEVELANIGKEGIGRVTSPSSSDYRISKFLVVVLFVFVSG
jgi:hypothetical protein